MSSMVAEMPRAKRNDITCKVDAAIIRKARLIASHRDLTLAEYLSNKLRLLVDKDFETFRKDINKTPTDEQFKD